MQSKALSRVFSNTTVQKHRFFSHGVTKSQRTERLTLSFSFTLIKKKKKKVFTFPINGQNFQYAMSASSVFIEIEVELLKKTFNYIWIVCEGKGAHKHDILLELQI